MSENKLNTHAPGPWSYHQEISRRYDVLTGDAKESETHCIRSGVPNETLAILVPSGAVTANARLIAAAPDMLKALQKAEMLLDQHMNYTSKPDAFEFKNVWKDVSIAIAKARGES